MRTKVLTFLLVMVMAFSSLSMIGCGAKVDGGPDDDAFEPDLNEDVNDPEDDPGEDVNDPEDDPGEDVSDPEDDPGEYVNGSETDPDDEELPGSDVDFTSLVFQMTDNSNNGALSSECRRYLAGEAENFSGSIDNLVKQRNDAAYAFTGITVTYEYLPNTNLYNWSKITSYIEALELSNSGDRPDVYCNFVYDMVKASLSGCFANLLSIAKGNDGNHFSFLEYDDEYVDGSDGYMYRYMSTLTLSDSKMYCLASDYFIDVVRASLVVPVNLSIIDSIAASDVEGQFNSDRNGDGDFNAEDLYSLVYDGGWCYATLTDICAAVSSDDENGIWDINDTVGFAISASYNLCSAGMLYSNPTNIISKSWSDFTQTYYYSLNGDTLMDYAQELNALFNSDGVISVNETDVIGYGDNSLGAIRERFADNKVLFGGVVCLGSLEHQTYRDMTNCDGGVEEGFGILPVPVYKYFGPNCYRTQVHNLGRVGAISRASLKFSQCSRLIDYLSTHSSQVINTYYDGLTLAESSDARADEAEMLRYIRSNLGYAMDKVFDEYVCSKLNYPGASSYNKRWDDIIMNERYKVPNMSIYIQLAYAKEDYLSSVVHDYGALHD